MCQGDERAHCRQSPVNQHPVDYHCQPDFGAALKSKEKTRQDQRNDYPWRILDPTTALWNNIKFVNDFIGRSRIRRAQQVADPLHVTGTDDCQCVLMLTLRYLL